MASPLSPLVLLATICVTIYYTGAENSLTELQVHAGSGIIGPPRKRRELPYERRLQVEKAQKAVIESLTIVKEVVNKIEVKTLKGILKGLAKFASIAPGIGGLVASIVDMALGFIPENNPVMDLLYDINYKLDSMSNQIGELKKDVEWFNYASIIGQDENKIISAWKEFAVFQKNSVSFESPKSKEMVKQRFITFYENGHIQGSVSNLFNYMTVTKISLNKNILELFATKFKCDINQVGTFNLYLSSLLWKGMVLNQLYFKLKGYPTDAQKDSDDLEHVKNIQQEVLLQCIATNDYIEPAVRELDHMLHLQVNQESAENLKKALDKKYSWFNWIVIVYKTANKAYHTFNKYKSITLNSELSIAVSHSNFKDQRDMGNVHICSYDDSSCEDLVNTISKKSVPYSRYSGRVGFTHFAALDYYYYYKDTYVAPTSFCNGQCKDSGYTYKFRVYARIPHSSELKTRWDPCKVSTCQKGECKWVKDTLEDVCM